ncbi:NADPH-dependent FMN reductase [Haloarchaeobius litoreus]|uniref:NADPH-dependent FMN reductase n=1 Tax=Haloarchaeobius litoreus TaxID=755306 RepID=A0ABD6DJ90_9EURY|nr:NADPH-dependent FMN reductase [Haloarchaeobius litoreus]
MRRNVHVLGLCGSLRDDSGTRTAIRRALTAADAAGATTELLDLREYELPPRDGDDADAGDAAALRERVAAADAVLLGSPVYHGSYASPLKTALDYCGSDEFEGTTVGLLAVAGGSYPTPALEHMRSVARAVGAWTLPLQVGIGDVGAAVADGDIVDADLAERVDRLGAELVAYAGVESYPTAVTETFDPVTGD